MRKIEICLLLVSVLALSSACGRQQGSKKEQSQTARIPIVIWSYYETQAQQESMNHLISDFNMTQSRYHASWEYVPMTEFTKRLSIGVTQDELPDLVIIDNPDVDRYVKIGLFQDITSYVKGLSDYSKYYKGVLKSVKNGSKYYGVPFCTNNLGLIYNKILFKKEKIKVPESWDEFQNACKSLTRKNCYGFAMSAMTGEQSAFQTLPWLLSETKNTITKESMLEGFKKIETLIHKGYMSQECINWSQNDVARKFVNGEVAMMENGPWVLPMLKESNITYGIATLPFLKQHRSISIIGGENLCVIKKKKITGAMKFLQFYNEDEVMDELCLRSYALPPKKAQAKLCAGKNRDYKVFVKQMNRAISRASFNHWSDLSELLTNGTYEILTGKKSAWKVTEQIMIQWKQK